jgi:hypothetical protein
MKKSTMIKTYSELSRLPTFEDRYEYLKLGGAVGSSTFGFDRHINQGFYKSTEWKHIRRRAIVRDNGCDLGMPEFEIHGNLLVHHMNPMTPDDIMHGDTSIMDLEFLITTTNDTHNAIHYGDASLIRTPYVEREPGDTKLW